jgi:peptidyl-prolyl cis-trans isomerase SurA
MRSLSKTWLSLVAIALAGVLCALQPASAQQVVARVNGEPITAIDVAQRSKLIQVSTQKPPDRKEVINELIEERLKLQTAHRYRLEVPDAEVENTFTSMATRMRSNPQQFAEVLSKAGISVPALKRKIRADIAWGQIVRGKFQSSLQVRDRDIAAANTGSKGADVAYDYTLRPILLIVSPKAGPDVIEARRKEAEALRARFTNCEDGVRLARGLRDVAIKEQLVKGSGDLPPKLRELLDALGVGKLTPPDITPQGVEVFALCNKQEAKGDTGRERDAREQMFGERYSAKGKQYMQELRRTAKIEVN